MKRDLDLIRKILLVVEASEDGWAPNPIEIDGYTSAQIGYHSWLIIDAGFAAGTDTTVTGGSPDWWISYLTWEGHEFLEAARDETRWNKAKSMVTSSAGTVTVSVLSQLLGNLMRQAVGL